VCVCVWGGGVLSNGGERHSEERVEQFVPTFSPDEHFFPSNTRVLSLAFSKAENGRKKTRKCERPLKLRNNIQGPVSTKV